MRAILSSLNWQPSAASRSATSNRASSRPSHAPASSTNADRRARFADELRRTGRLRDSARLRPSEQGKRARRDAGPPRIDDGPFREDGKALAAYYWVHADSVDDAAALAAACPVLAGDDIDVRPVTKGAVEADKDARPGKVFACVVLGTAASEEQWTQVMDRIDALRSSSGGAT